MCAKIGNVGTVTEERDISAARSQVKVQTPSGAHSDTFITNDVLALKLRGNIRSGIGRPDESRTISVFLCKLREKGCEASLETGRDEFGEDGILQFQNQRLALQVVTVPSSPGLWQNANRDLINKTESKATSIKWIYDAIQTKHAKTSPNERAKTILLLDIGLMGVLAEKEVVDNYLKLHGDPHAVFKFSSIWLVGPTSSTTTQLGTGSLQFSSIT